MEFQGSLSCSFSGSYFLFFLFTLFSCFNVYLLLYLPLLRHLYSVSVLTFFVPVSLRPSSPQKALSSLIGQLSQARAGTAHQASASVLLVFVKPGLGIG